MNETRSRLQALRATLKERGVDGFILPVADEFLGEYVPDSAQRLRWLTGFSGSAGLVAVLADKAVLFTDGRYTIQARMEIDAVHYDTINIGDKRPEVWLADEMKEGARLGLDPWLHSMREVERLTAALAKKKITLVPLEPNPVDALWGDRPEDPQTPIYIHRIEYSGEEHAIKRKRVAEKIAATGASAMVAVATDSVNWMLNIRAQDLAYTPVARAYAVTEANGRVWLYTNPDRVGAEVCARLVPDVDTRPVTRLRGDLQRLGEEERAVLLDPVFTPWWFQRALEAAGAKIVRADDPCQPLKAVKNETELSGIRSAHLRDGAALSRFLCWLDFEAERRDVTEREAAAQLLQFRKQANDFVCPSFETIAGSGPNGAIVHYRVTSETNRVLHRDELFLLDSGGQYPDGTTDVTRTVVVGSPSAEHRDRYTRVLKGHIAIARARFPEGTSGSSLDALARAPLWEAGVDYDHGTGHGVGCFLSVHEGPQRISKRGGDAPLEPGMIVSNEPGYYKEGAYGIRIENLVAVKEVGKMESGKRLLGFETLTCTPFDLRLIDASLLNAEEKAWLNQYHAWVRRELKARLGEREQLWLQQATKPVE